MDSKKQRFSKVSTGWKEESLSLSLSPVFLINENYFIIACAEPKNRDPRVSKRGHEAKKTHLSSVYNFFPLPLLFLRLRLRSIRVYAAATRNLTYNPKRCNVWRKVCAGNKLFALGQEVDAEAAKLILLRNVIKLI